MINFRFHIVSLIAVFLALGLGILVGSTVVDQVIVDRLDHEIKDVRNDSSRANAESSNLKAQVSQYEDFLKKAAPFAVEQRLPEVPVTVVAEKGVSSDVAKSTVEMLRDAGAVVPGVIWLNDSWNLNGTKDLASLQSAVRVSGNNAAARTAALRLLARRLASPPTNGASRADVLNGLEREGFISLTDGDKKALADFPARAGRVLVLTGTDTHLEGSDTLADFATALSANSIPAVVGEVYDEQHQTPPAERGAALAPVRGDSSLATNVSTVDDAELTQGQVAEVIALEQIASHTVGHYGTGQGAQAPLPHFPS